MKSPANYVKYLKTRIRQNKKTFTVYSVLRVLVILTLIRQLVTRKTTLKLRFRRYLRQRFMSSSTQLKS